MIPTYIIHHTPLKDRKEYLLRTLPWAQFIENSEYLISYHNDPTLWESRTSGLYSETIPSRVLSGGDMDCTTKHFEALTRISNLSVPGLILEDDAILLEGFWECLNETIQIKNSHLWDILFIGGAFPHTVAPTLSYDDKSPFVLKGHPCTNTVCSYIVKPKIATAIAHRLYKFGAALPIDFEFNYICRELGLMVCHYLPYVVQEGSSAGYYKGSQVR